MLIYFWFMIIFAEITDENCQPDVWRSMQAFWRSSLLHELIVKLSEIRKGNFPRKGVSSYLHVDLGGFKLARPLSLRCLRFQEKRLKRLMHITLFRCPSPSISLKSLCQHMRLSFELQLKTVQNQLALVLSPMAATGSFWQMLSP